MAWTVAIVGAAGLTASAEDRIPVKSADDLPRHTYKVAGKASSLVKSDAEMDVLRKQVRDDVLADLQKYDIKDPTTLKDYQLVLLNDAMLAGEWDQVLTQVGKLRELEEKEAAKLTTGLSSEAIALAHKEAGKDDAKFRTAFKRILAEKAKALPWAVVGDDLQARHGSAQILSEALIMGQVEGRMDPIIEKLGGEVSADIAQSLLAIRTQLKIIIPLKDEMVAALGAAIDANKAAKKDIWQERDVALPAGGKFSPVVVGVWDSGVDIKLYKDQLWTNDKEQPNGKDDDGNGFVDDVHGIAYDLDHNRVPELLLPIDGLTRDVAEVTKYTKGFLDLQAGLSTPEADALRQKMGSLKPDEVKPFVEDVSLFGNYSHGTHVAGIALAGNPYARLFTARITFDYHMIPVKPTVEKAEKDAQEIRDVVAYFKRAGVRVVNMSWGGSRKDEEAALEANGVDDVKERTELARKIFKIQRDALETAIKDAPDILFVAAAGNADNDVLFDEMIPSGIEAPNLLVVGAVDQAGDPTSFTSFGKTVKVYASGFEVESFIPGGQRIKYSGTSMASPEVTNLAAKVLAQKPSLKPGEVIDLIVRGGDKTKSGDNELLLINPKKTLQLAGQ